MNKLLDSGEICLVIDSRSVCGKVYIGEIMTVHCSNEGPNAIYPTSVNTVTVITRDPPVATNVPTTVRLQQTDNDILREVVEEWVSGAGSSIVVKAVVRMLMQLEQGFGPRFDIERVQQALRDLAETSTQVHGNIAELLAKRHPKR
jgi:hypothetical protein